MGGGFGLVAGAGGGGPNGVCLLGWRGLDDRVGLFGESVARYLLGEGTGVMSGVDEDLVARSRKQVFAVCAMAFYVIMFDLAAVNVAFPDILTDFEVTRADGSWIVTLYNILFGSLLVVAGKTADRVGRRRIFQIGIACFGLGAAVAAFAPNLGVLLVGRAIQGIGAALLSPAAIGLLVAAFPSRQRTRIMALWGAVGALGVSSGPSLGAAAIQVTNWRAVFWIPLAICVVLLIASKTVLSESPIDESKERTDYVGAAVITAGLAVLVLGVSRSGVWGWVNPATIASIVVGLVATAIFVARQRHLSSQARRSPQVRRSLLISPILDLSLFRSRSFSVAGFSGFIFFGGYAAYNLNNVLFLRQAWSYSVLEAGLIAVIGPVTVAMLSPSAGRAAMRVGFRLPSIFGALVTAAGTTALAVSFDETRRPGLFMAFVIVVAMGIASFMPTNAGASVAELPAERLSVGGAVSQSLRQVGAAFGVALLVAVVGTPETASELVVAHSNGYWLVTVVMVLAAILSQWQTGRSQSIVSQSTDSGKST